MDSYELLGNAIVKQAVEEYRLAYLGYKVLDWEPERTLKDVEGFVKSSWYETLTDIDGKNLLKKVRIMTLEELIESLSVFISPSTTGAKIKLSYKVSQKEKKTFEIPPILEDAFVETIVKQIEMLKKQLEKEKSGNGE